MGLTRKFLKGLGIEDSNIELIIDAHAETVDGLKSDLKAAQEKAAQFDTISAELAGYKEKDYRKLYEDEHAAFDSYKADVAAKSAQAAKEKAARAYFEGKKITGNNLAIAMRGAKDEIKALELDEQGGLKDSTKLDDLVKGDYAGLIVTTATKGADTATPPENTGGRMTKEEIFAIKDTAKRQKAIAENIDLFN